MSGLTSDNQIRGAFGTLSDHDTSERRGYRGRLLALLAVIGPGLIVMVGDNDAGGVSTYAQAGQNFGYSLLWTLPLLIPVLVVNQEMVARLGVVTGVGHGRLIRERIGRRWGTFSISAILFLNSLIIVTEFIGISLSMRYFGVSPFASVPVAAVALFAMTVTGSFRRWERFMMLFVAVNAVVIPLIIHAHLSGARIAHGLVVPHVRGGFSSAGVLLIISIIGTTVAPWQLFFQESNIVDKKISPRWMNYERADTIIGSFVVVIVATLLMGVTAAGLSSHGGTNAYTNALAVARGLGQHVGHGSGTLFALILLNASIIGAAVVTLASSYALGDLSNRFNQGLNVPFREGRDFYGAFGALLVAAGVVTLVPGAPLGLITLAVQALCGLMLPSTTIIVLLLANDRAALGPWVNPRWLNALAVVIVTVLTVLSIVMMISTLFPSAPVVTLLETFGAMGVVGLIVGLPLGLRRAGPRPVYAGDRLDWRTPRLALLESLPRTRGRTWLLRGVATYLTLAGVLLVVRIAQLATS
ncbi:MAG TPA: NRAMP family divalent metal transporter [Acidimicrobiales bacterium]|nr:NRAMP family divalent metal transporter [Acidimicrobiales bacterium]